MLQKIIISTFGMLLSSHILANNVLPNPDKPNIIVILADDLGYGDLGCYGGTSIQTPNINRLAAEGIKLTDFHSNGAVCTPTRAALLTGRYQQRAGIEGVILVRGESSRGGLDTSNTTLAELLQQEGYATGLIGKWHLGYQPCYHPNLHGFDEFRGYLSGNVDYHSHYDAALRYDWWHNSDAINEDGYSTDLITDHAVNFITQHKDRPFFLMVAEEAPHFPIQGRKDPAQRLPGKKFNPLGSVEDPEATYREMIEVMDEGIGRILQTLEDSQLENNTLVIFMSDNGSEKPYGSNGSLKGQKGSLAEGGHRVPGIAYWKGKIAPRESDETILSMDILPTVLTICGIQAPHSLHFDGVDVSETLLNGRQVKNRSLFWRTANEKAVRSGDFKLIVSPNDTSLYNLRADLREIDNIAVRHPGKVQRMLKELDTWERSVGPRSAMSL